MGEDMPQNGAGDSGADQPQPTTFRSRMEWQLQTLTQQYETISDQVKSVPQQLADLTLLVKTFIASAPTQQQLKDGLEERVRQDVFVEILKSLNQRLDRLEGTFQRLAPWVSIGMAAAAFLEAWVSAHH